MFTRTRLSRVCSLRVVFGNHSTINIYFQIDAYNIAPQSIHHNNIIIIIHTEAW